MGVDLIGHGGISMNWNGWRSCLQLAVAFGWEPAGTLGPMRYGPYDVTRAWTHKRVAKCG